MNNYWWISIVLLHVLTWGIYIAKHGEPRTGTWNAWVALGASVVWLFVIYQAIETGF